MPPKNKGKKGKKGDDDYWDKVGESVAPGTPTSDDLPASSNKVSFSGFAALDMGAADDTAPPDEDEDFGGLMSTLKATKGKKD
ncbi:hypothetical protein FB45DRAFT_1054668 [Roridomyces roridus]|uniref:Uncharacterized protein n=1 Tax=Roridomyces roridus TaxID=1738132 RepID=A0AAD7FUL7_9AGAR|nr:hypothetical protein FB45DRAFT_1054668 [Roridomyces roridus]